ncbi:FemAB family XrtA/PEP-CTERM system-associated protein [Methylocaldum szegediense]|uniref:FemAB-related protein (PEP-CTERM system-associated) n=1 Tax=Methylocaldum szegediense TaxID=73780 RepID=A0ABM9I8X6_9GAMM|nr:FemAB family XrtA/PEP-CTERM system-associated protein [Methylocaldum szegediense]CAI8965854.1 FemAB-related protein (PEP-CTERM system-associated) [Methylocaldum szegediense]
MEIKQLDESRKSDWDTFVNNCAEATFFHLTGWRDVVERAFGHKTHYLFAEDEGRIVGVLPLGHIRSLLFGNALISSPFCVYGGAVAESDSVRVALEEEACRLARELGVDYLELRNMKSRGSGRPSKSLYVTFRKALDPDPEKNLAAVPRKQRAMIRKGIAAGLHSVIDSGIDRFFAAYSESVRNLGTPVFSKRYFAILKEVFGDACEILSVEHHGRVIASVMSFYFRDEVLPYYGGGTEQARDLKGNDFMYWEVMRRATEKGVRVFDYGRSKVGTGSYRFKTHWGFEPQPLPYEYELVKAKTVPEVNPLNPKYRYFIAAWQRLPLPVSNLVGPWISRSLG